MTSQGATLSFTWPAPLPTPSVSGGMLTYRSVLPGVNLVVSATASGGFNEVLVVTSRSAAADRGLRNVQLAISATGVAVAPAIGGGLEARSSDGRVLFDSPVASMWDSTSSPSTGSPTMDTPTVRSPGLFAHQSVVGVAVTHTSESIVPDTALLSSKSTRFPLYIDPTWAPRYQTATKPAFDEVKQGSPCNTQTYYDDAGSDADNGELGVGYNGWPGGCDGNDAAFYMFTIPTAVKGATVINATMNATEVYSATCATTKYAVDITMTGAITKSTDWNNKPGSSGSAYTSTATTVGPACTSHPAAGFTAKAAVAHVVGANGSTVTLELYEPTNYTDYALKRFADNPTLQIEYDHTPAVPSISQLSMTSGSTTDPCDDSSPFPYMGKTAATSPPKLNAKLSDSDGDPMEATFTYWNTASTSRPTLTSAEVTNGGTASVTLPSTFISGLGASATVAYNVKVTDFYATSGSSVTCEVNIQAKGADAPVVTSTVWPDADTGTGAPAGSPGAFTFTSSSTATSFIFALQSAPPTTNPPAADVVAASGGVAHPTLTPTLHGLNRLYVYVKDSAGNITGPTLYQFLTSDTAPQTYSSLNAAYNDTGISPDAAPTEGNFGGGVSFSATDLTNEGWASGSTITVDGASLTLPTYGAGQPDNVSVANQTINLNDLQDPNSGQYANALVMLAWGVYPNATTSPSGGPPAADTAAPYLNPGSRFAASCPDTTGQNCAQSGTLQYAGSTADYQTEVPDWALGDRAQAVYQGTHVNTPSGPSSTHLPSIYPIVIPLDPTQQLTSITLPDLSANSTGNSPSMHILAMGLRNNTVANAPAGQTWSGSWAEPVEKTVAGGTNYTVRTAIRPTLSGSTLRLKFDNALGTAPLAITQVTVADAGSSFTSGTPIDAPVTVTFHGGSLGASLAQGADVNSDPTPFTVTAGSWIYVSYALSGTNVVLPAHTLATDAYTLVTANGTGNHAADTAATAFAATATPNSSLLLTGLDVASSNISTVAVLGDQFTNPTVTGSKAITSAGTASLADDLSGSSPGFGYVNAGIEGNLLATDAQSTANGGPSALARLDRDVLDQPNIGTVVITEGLQDALNTASTLTLANFVYPSLVQQFAAFGVNVVLTTLTPCHGNTACPATVEDGSSGSIDTLDNVIVGQANYQSPAPGIVVVSVVDLAALVGDTATPQSLQVTTSSPPGQGYDSGDHMNLTPQAYLDEAGLLASSTVLYPNAL